MKHDFRVRSVRTDGPRSCQNCGLWDHEAPQGCRPKFTDTERLDRVLLFLNKASVYGLAGKVFTRRGIDAAIRAGRNKI